MTRDTFKAKGTTPPAAPQQQGQVDALEVFRIAGGDTECEPNPTPERALEVLLDLRACYDEAITQQPVRDDPIDASDNAEYIEHCADRLERCGLPVTGGVLRVIAHEHRTLAKQAAAAHEPCAAVAAIQFALTDPEGMTFLRLWNEGEFDTLRREWPDAPRGVYDGADPLA